MTDKKANDEPDGAPHPMLFSDMPDDTTTQALITLYQDGALEAWWDQETETTKMRMPEEVVETVKRWENAPPDLFDQAIKQIGHERTEE